MKAQPHSRTAPGAPSARIRAVRRFNRFYTRQIGVLEEHLLDSPYSLTEVRVLYELAQRGTSTARDIGRDTGLDRGYLSRILTRFEGSSLIEKQPLCSDARQSLLSLTPKGRRAFAPLDKRASREVGALLGKVPEAAQKRLVEAMGTVELLLSGKSSAADEAAAPYLLRPHRPGDMGWVIHRHGVLYSEEYGYDEHFEALVAQIAAGFIEHFDPERERCWIAERDGERVGSVFLVKKSPAVAKLRLLLVEPKARGLGIGKRLVSECTRFARQAGYRKLMLWTQSELIAARRIYQAEGYRLVERKPHRSWGKSLVAETWALEL